MVVYSHVLTFGMGNVTPSPIGAWMRDVMLPLFFTISGYCACRIDIGMELNQLVSQIWSKTRSILIPTVVMFLLFMAYSHNGISHYVMSYDKSGYWFTWVLFQILLVYYTSLFIAAHVRNIFGKIIVVCSPLPVMWVLGYLFGFSSEIAVVFEWIKVKQFYFFFLTGFFLRYSEPTVKRILSLPLVNSALLVACVLTFNLHNLGGVICR